VAPARLGDEDVLLAKPLLYMNRSGGPVARLLAEAQASPADLVVVVDDTALDLGTILITQGGSWQDVLRSTLGNPSTDRLRLTAAHSWAQANGFGHGWPTFHEANPGGTGVVHGTYAVTPAAVNWQDVPVSQILGANIDPTTRPLENWFTGASDWAATNNVPAAMPNGHYANYGGNWVVGIMSFNPGYAQWRDLTGDDLGYPRQYTVGPGW